MKKILAALVAVAALTAAAPAFGADLGARPYYNKAPVYAPRRSTTGPASISAAMSAAPSAAATTSTAAVLSNSSARVLGGVQAGARLAVRAELGARRRGPVFLARQEQPQRHLPRRLRLQQRPARRSARSPARIGYTWGPGLLYVKGGYAYSDNSETLTLGGVPVAFLLNGNHSNGWTVGAGVEYMFAPNWSVKGEYMYYDFGSTRFVTPAALAPFGSFHTDDHTLKLGVNYRFNFASPVVARY